METHLLPLEVAEWRAFFKLEHAVSEERRLTHIAQQASLADLSRK